MPTYVKIGYTVPAMATQWVNIPPNIYDTAWVQITTIPRPATATFFYYWDSTMKLTLKRLFAGGGVPKWDIDAYLQLANTAGTVGVDIHIASSSTQNITYGEIDAVAYMSRQGTALNWTAPVGNLTQARVRIVAFRSAGTGGCDVTVDVVAGKLQVYSEC